MTIERAYIALGSNLGDRAALLNKAIELLSERVGNIVAESKVMESKPVEFASEHPFLNQVIGLDTELDPQALLVCTQEIERELGRTHKSVGGEHFDRTCDIDIILYGSWVVEEEGLQIPHPRFRARRFVLEPLAEIAPQVMDPVTNKTVEQLLWGV